MSTRFSFPSLICDEPAHYLAALGLVRVFPGSRLSFDGLVPVFDVEEDLTLEELAERAGSFVGEYLCSVRRLGSMVVGRPLEQIAFYETNVVSINRMLSSSWFETDPIYQLNTTQVETFVKKKKSSGDDTSSKFTVYARKSRFLSSAKDPWFGSILSLFSRDISKKAKTDAALVALHEKWKSEQISYFTSIFTGLFASQVPVGVVSPSSALGLSLSDIASSERYIGDRYVMLGAEILASVAIPYLPVRGQINGQRGSLWLRWHLNIMPMGWDALVALQRREAVPGFVTYETKMVAGQGTMSNYYRYDSPIEIESRRKATNNAY